jgi:3-isopropylmalate/(R)-2-methylmalate dehydratase large subunit
MGMTMIEKILAHHSDYDVVRPGEIINISLDLKILRDLGGANIVKQIEDSEVNIHDTSNTFFTFDYYHTFANTGIAENQQYCRRFAKNHNIRVFDIHSGIGTHIMIDQGYALPSRIMASTDSHSNILGAIGALGCGLNEKEMLTALTKNKIWYRVPKSLKINLTGQLPEKLTPKDLGLNLMSIFKSNKLLGYAVEFSGSVIDLLSLDGRITLASLANEMGALTFLMQPNQEVMDYCYYKSGQPLNIFIPDIDAEYDDVLNIDVSKFKSMISLPGEGEIIPLEKVLQTNIDSAFIGTCTNGRIEDLRLAAGILKGRKVAPGVILKIVPSTDEIWTLALQEGLIDIFKESGAMVANAGCGGCSSGNSSHAGLGQITISSGNKNFYGHSGKSEVYLSSPAIVAASAIAGYITTTERIPEQTQKLFSFSNKSNSTSYLKTEEPKIFEGKAWNIPYNDVDTEKIYHSKYNQLTDIKEFGNYTFSEFEGLENFADQARPGDILIVGENFGKGNSSKHAVDCFKSLGIQAIIAKSFAGIYEKDAINSGLPVFVCSKIDKLEIQTGDSIKVNISTGLISNSRNHKAVKADKYAGILVNSMVNV